MSIYVSSRASLERMNMWKMLRANGLNIISTWIDQPNKDEIDFSYLWVKIENEIRQSDKLVFFAEPRDFPLKGAFVEVGMAIGMFKQIIVCLPDVQVSLVGSWINHPFVKRIDDLPTAMKA
jgi:hypothetical protein